MGSSCCSGGMPSSFANCYNRNLTHRRELNIFIFCLPACTPCRKAMLVYKPPTALPPLGRRRPAWRQPEAQPRPVSSTAFTSHTTSICAAMASPQVIRDAAAMRAWSREQRRQGKTVGFVPTMVRHALDYARLPRGGHSTLLVSGAPCSAAGLPPRGPHFAGQGRQVRMRYAALAELFGVAAAAAAAAAACPSPVARATGNFLHASLPQTAVRCGGGLHLRQPHPVLRQRRLWRLPPQRGMRAWLGRVRSVALPLLEPRAGHGHCCVAGLIHVAAHSQDTASPTPAG